MPTTITMSKVLVALDVTPRLWNTGDIEIAMSKLGLILNELKNRDFKVREVRASVNDVHAIIAAPPDDVPIARLQAIANEVRDAVNQREEMSRIDYRALYDDAIDGLIWCSASEDFQVGGKAREGWERGPRPAIERWCALRKTHEHVNQAKGKPLAAATAAELVNANIPMIGSPWAPTQTFQIRQEFKSHDPSKITESIKKALTARSLVEYSEDHDDRDAQSFATLYRGKFLDGGVAERREPDGSLRKRLFSSAWKLGGNSFAENSERERMINNASGKELDAIAVFAGLSRRSIATGVDMAKPGSGDKSVALTVSQDKDGTRTIEDIREVPKAKDILETILRRRHLARLHAKEPTHVLVTAVQLHALRSDPSASPHVVCSPNTRAQIHGMIVMVENTPEYACDLPAVV